MISDHAYCFLKPLIHWETCGSPTSFYTRSYLTTSPPHGDFRACLDYGEEVHQSKKLGEWSIQLATKNGFFNPPMFTLHPSLLQRTNFKHGWKNDMATTWKHFLLGRSQEVTGGQVCRATPYPRTKNLTSKESPTWGTCLMLFLPHHVLHTNRYLI